MPYKYTLVKTPLELESLGRRMTDSKQLQLDIETTSLNPRDGVIRLIQINTGNDISIIDLWALEYQADLEPILNALNNPDAAVGEGRPLVIGQNLKFEQKWLQHHYGVMLWPMYCTMRASNVISGGIRLKHDLGSLYRRYMPALKAVKHEFEGGRSDWSKPVLSEEQLQYAAEDVAHCHTLKDITRARVKELKMLPILLAELQAIWPEAEMELTGFKIDVPKWTALAKSNMAGAERLRVELMKALPSPHGQMTLMGFSNTWNLGSPVQLKASLRKMGAELESTDADAMALIAAKYPVALKILEWKGYTTRAKNFGLKYLRHVREDTGCIHTSYNPFGAATGRYACVGGSTPVLTSKGLKPIEGVRPGDFVWTHRERWREVTAFLPQGSQETVDIRLSNGQTLTCTPDHRLLTSEWTAADALEGKSLTGKGGQRVEVLGIEWGGFNPVYDLQVMDDESYLTHGIYSHNCSGPNLQQIPRTADFRSCFVAIAGWVLLVCDYSQIEVRLIAQASQDKELLRIFRDGEDPYKATIARLLDIAIEDVTKDQRQKAKPVLLGYMYGMKARSMVVYAQATFGVTMTVAEAEADRRKFFAAFPGLARYQAYQLAKFKPMMKVWGMGGRVRHLTHHAHNEYINTPIQAAGALGMKLAIWRVLLRFRKILRDGQRVAKVVHMVHDEIVAMCLNRPDVIAEASRELEAGMIEACKRLMPDVSCEADSNEGPDWAAAKD